MAPDGTKLIDTTSLAPATRRDLKTVNAQASFSETPTEQVKIAHAKDLMQQVYLGRMKLGDITKAQWDALSADDRGLVRSYAELNHQKSPAFDDDEDNGQPQKKNHFWGWLLEASGIAAIAETTKKLWHPHHHWGRDVRILKDLWKIGRRAHRAEEAERDARHAKDAERAKRDERLVKDGEQVKRDKQIAKDADRGERDSHDLERAEHDLHAGDKALHGAEIIGKDGHLAEEIAKVGRLGETFKHIGAGVGIVSATGALGFVAKRAIEGEIVYNLALQSHPDKAEQWRNQVMFRSPLTKEATEEWNKGNYVSALKLEVQGTVDDVKSLAAYLSNKDQVKKDFAAAQDGYQALQTIYAKDPQKAKELVVGLAQDLGLFADMGLKNGDAADILHSLVMGDQNSAAQTAKGLGMEALKQPGMPDKVMGQARQAQELKNLVDTTKSNQAGPNAPQQNIGATVSTKKDNLG